MGGKSEVRRTLSVDEQLCFALYSASRAFTGLYRDLLADLDLTYPQYLVMLVLWERGPQPVKELGAALRLDSGTLSPLLRRLEAAGLVHRERAGDDERVVRAVPTERGTALRERAAGIPAAVLNAAGVDRAQADDLRLRLHAITDSVTGAPHADAPETTTISTHEERP